MTPEEPLLTRPFYPMIKRCDDVIGRLNLMESEMTRYRIKNLATRNYKNFLERIYDYSSEQDVPENRWMEHIEHNLE
jgi:V-type H+-transporting ATPase subunit a